AQGGDTGELFAISTRDHTEALATVEHRRSMKHIAKDRHVSRLLLNIRVPLVIFDRRRSSRFICGIQFAKVLHLFQPLNLCCVVRYQLLSRLSHSWGSTRRLLLKIRPKLTRVAKEQRFPKEIFNLRDSIWMPMFD